MENMKSQPPQESETPISSTEIVSKVLSQTSANNTFLKNAGLETPGSKTAASSAKNIRLEAELEAEKQRSDHLAQELDSLKIKQAAAEEEMAKTKQEFEEFKKKQIENDLILKRILSLHQA